MVSENDSDVKIPEEENSDSSDIDITEAKTIQAKPLEMAEGSDESDVTPSDSEKDSAKSDSGDTGTTSAPGSICEGMKIGRFSLIRRLGKGGMGEVWLAKQDSMNRDVALKMLNATLIDSDPEFIERFMIEIENTGKMNHPNIITAFDSGKDNQLVYLATTYVEGEPLNEVLEREGSLPEERSLKIIRDIADALRYSWNTFNIIHRDIKPQNIMIDKKSNSPKLMDMGLAKSLGSDQAQLTMTGVILGTPYYMSPEQAIAQKDVDFRIDIYSLGATLYHLVTGCLPYKGKTLMGIIEQVVKGEMVPAHERNEEVSENCSLLIKKMTAKEAGDRQNSWEEVIRDIDLVLKGESPRITEKKEPVASAESSTQEETKSETPAVDDDDLDEGPNLPVIIMVTVVILVIIAALVVFLVMS